MVDIDEGMTTLFQTNEMLVKHNQNALNNPKVKVINADAFIWVKENKEKFDVIIIDFPDPSNYSLGKLYTTNFYCALNESMHIQTIIAVQTTSTYFAP